MRRLERVVLGTAVVGTMAGCGAHPSDAGRPAAPIAPARSPLTTIATDLRALAEPPQVAPPTRVRAPAPAAGGDVIVVAGMVWSSSATSAPVTLVGTDGRVVAHADVPIDSQWTVSAGRGGAYWVAAGHLQRLGVDGARSDLGALAPGQDGRVAIAPDGNTWIYASSVTAKDGSIDNRLWRGAPGRAPSLLAQHAGGGADPSANAPQSWHYAVKSWTASGVLVVQEPTGGCGCGAFDMEMMAGHSSLVDPVTGVATSVTADNSCPLSDVGPGGVSACFHGGGSGADALRIHAPTATQTFSMSGTSLAGDARFDATDSHLAYATTPVDSGCGAWAQQTTLRVLDVAAGSARAVGPKGLQPAAWLQDGRMVATLTTAATGGEESAAVVTVDLASGAVRPVLSGGDLRVVGISEL